MNGKILAIAGSDPSGGAGIQADIKTISALGGYAMAAITALTVQNTQKVYDVHPVAADIVAAQVMAVLDDIRPDAVKMGMMGTSETLSVLTGIFSENKDIPLIVDPVLLSTSGHALLDPRGVEGMISEMFPLTYLLTPNLAEAALLAGVETIEDIPDMTRAGEALLNLGPKAVLVKGGHLSGEILTDLLVTPEGVYEFSSPVIASRHTHGTGCTLASAIATGLAQGRGLRQAVARAHAYVHKAIAQAPGFGHGKGPLNHLVTLD
ncbi:MAG: bifunctional hydroxymethylpyrimidine kinase/phosphomethylpyrimidine kinase [Alphaproteobacteria bacterium]|nr:MAG: bifunctional hydroxymethylpyrimidine kinase/phosphomethylpyrimidine kinase [Alphaproteobacteria bacterium]